MKTYISCFECMREDNPSFLWEINEINDDLILESVCSFGHKSYLLLLNNKFEVLYDMGIDSLINNRPLESAVYLYLSLESVREWAIKAILKSREPFTQCEFEKMWHNLTKQSERLFGSYSALIFKEFGQSPPNVSIATIELRNRIIHKGYLPLVTEVQSMAKDITQTIVETVSLVRSNEKYWINPDLAERVSRFKELSTNTLSGSSSLPTTFWSIKSLDVIKEITLEKAIQNVVKHNEMIESTQRMTEHYKMKFGKC